MKRQPVGKSVLRHRRRFDTISPALRRSEAFIRMLNPSPWRHVFAGTVFAVTLMLGAFGGLWLDRRFGLSPWGTILGASVGFAAGIYNLVREFKDDFKR